MEKYLTNGSATRVVLQNFFCPNLDTCQMIICLRHYSALRKSLYLHGENTTVNQPLNGGTILRFVRFIFALMMTRLFKKQMQNRIRIITLVLAPYLCPGTYLCPISCFKHEDSARRWPLSMFFFATNKKSHHLSVHAPLNECNISVPHDV